MKQEYDFYELYCKHCPRRYESEAPMCLDCPYDLEDELEEIDCGEYGDEEED